MNCALTATGADGAANSASTCTASAGNGTALQTYVGGAARRAFSVSLKRRTGSGTVEVTTDNGLTWCNMTTALADGMAGGCQWVRFSQYRNDWHDSTAATCGGGCGALTQSLVNPVFGIRLGTNADAVDVDFAQLEAGYWATTPMNGASRAADVVSIAPSGSWPVAVGFVEATVTPAWVLNGAGDSDYHTVFDGRPGGGNGDAQYEYIQDTGGTATYGVRNAGAPTQSTAALVSAPSAWVGDLLFGAPRLHRVEWDSGRIRYRLNGVTRNTSVVAVNLPAAAPVAFKLGALYDSTLQFNGFIGNIRIGKTVAYNRTVAATVGDSILRGAYVVYVSAAIQAAKIARSVYVSPYAVSGAAIAACTTQYTGSVQGTDVTHVINNCGINDLLGGSSAAVAWGAMQTLLNQQVSDGFKVVAVNLTPCAGYGSCTGGVQSNVVTFNASLAAWVASNSTVATLVDANTLLLGAANTLATRCTDEAGADFLHPDDSCSIEYANAIAGALP